MPKDAGLFPRAVPPRSTRCRQKGLYTILDGVEGPGPVRRHLPGLGGAQHRLVGRGRDQVLPGWRQGIPDHLRHGHRGLLLRLVRLRAPPARTASGTTHAFSTPYTGLPQVIPPDKHERTRPAFRPVSLAHRRPGPLRARTCKVTIQALGWQSGGRYLPLQDDIASVGFWYQKEPHKKFPKLPGRGYERADSATMNEPLERPVPTQLHQDHRPGRFRRDAALPARWQRRRQEMAGGLPRLASQAPASRIVGPA